MVRPNSVPGIELVVMVHSVLLTPYSAPFPPPNPSTIPGVADNKSIGEHNIQHSTSSTRDENIIHSYISSPSPLPSSTASKTRNQHQTHPPLHPPPAHTQNRTLQGCIFSQIPPPRPHRTATTALRLYDVERATAAPPPPPPLDHGRERPAGYDRTTQGRADLIQPARLTKRLQGTGKQPRAQGQRRRHQPGRDDDSVSIPPSPSPTLTPTR